MIRCAMKRLCPVVLVMVVALLASAQNLVLTNPPPAYVGLAWDAEPASNNIALYKLYWGVASRTYTNSLPFTNNTGTVSNLIRGVTYYFGATAVNTNGLESTNFSNEVSTNSPVPPPPPTVLRLINGN